MISQSTHTITGRSVKELLTKAFDKVSGSGEDYQDQNGELKVLREVLLILEEPAAKIDRYPFWDESSENWYQDNFINPDLGAPENSATNLILPFRYSWRSNYSDQGWSHALSAINHLQRLNYTELPFSRTEDLEQLIRETYTQFHPDLLLSTLSWLKRYSINQFLIGPAVLENIVNLIRRDLVEDLINQFSTDPINNQIIMPSLIYPQIDHTQFLEILPSYLNYHVLPALDRKQHPVGIKSLSLRRELNANGSGQLSLAHDIYWGDLVAAKTNLPLNQVSIFCYQLFLYKDQETNKPLEIQPQLFSETGGYLAEDFDINAYLAVSRTKRKIAATLENLS